MLKNIQDSLIAIIRSACQDLGADQPCADVTLDIPSDSRFGDFSSNIALRLAKVLQKNPRDVASELVVLVHTHLAADSSAQYISAVKAEGAGFINFYVSHAYLYEQLTDIIRQDKKFIQSDAGGGRRVIIEFVSANPTGPLSVAHARAAAVGDCLANILACLGYAVGREYYLNDEGNQINILGNSIALRLKELSGETISFPEDHYQGDYIYDIAREIGEKKLTINDFSEYGVAYILAIIQRELEDFGVRFDCWYSQKGLRSNGKIDAALALLRAKGFIYDQDGAVWFKSSAFGDDKDRVVIKSDGSFTYLAPDIAYHQDKYNRGYTWLINLWGPDHHGYINRLKASVAASGHDPETLRVVIVQLATIFRDGKPVQMSTRRGQYITLREVLDEVGRDAARFFFLMRRTSSHLDFDLAVAKKQTSENPVYYVQYAHARICSIVRSGQGERAAGGLNPDLLKAHEELALIKKLCQIQPTLAICACTQDPYFLTAYLQEVAASFHKFYDVHRVLGQDMQLTQARLALVEATRIILAAGLGLLGVSAPEKM